jgi:hypothetical protein
LFATFFSPSTFGSFGIGSNFESYNSVEPFFYPTVHFLSRSLMPAFQLFPFSNFIFLLFRFGC